MDIEKYLQSGKLEQYVLGLSSLEERKEVERLAKEFPAIDNYILELHKSMNKCSEANEIPIVDEPKHRSRCKTFHLRSKKSLVVESNSDSAFQKPNYIFWFSGIASFFIIGLSILSLFLYQDKQAVNNEISLLSTQLHHLKLNNELLLNESKKISQQFAVLKDANTHHVNLNGLKNAPKAYGIIYWNENYGKAYLSVCDLPEKPEGHKFCVWANVGGKHKKIGELDSSCADSLHNILFTKACNGFCVTLEKEGVGSPTVEKMLVRGDM